MNTKRSERMNEFERKGFALVKGVAGYCAKRDRGE